MIKPNRKQNNRWIGLSSLYLAQAKGLDNSFFRRIGEEFFGTKNTGAPTGARNLGQIILIVIEVLLLVAASIAVIYLIIGGYQYVMSRGNEEAAEKAKKTLSSSILGLVIIVLSFAIVRIISAILLQRDVGI